MNDGRRAGIAINVHKLLFTLENLRASLPEQFSATRSYKHNLMTLISFTREMLKSYLKLNRSARS